MARTPHAGIGGQLVERYLHYAICAACGMRQGGLRSRRLTTTTTTRLCVCVRGARVVADVRCVLSIRLKLKTCLTQGVRCVLFSTLNSQTQIEISNSTVTCYTILYSSMVLILILIFYFYIL